MDWQAFVFDPNNHWIERLERRAKQRFTDPNLADEAMNYALKALSDDHWARLQGYQNKAQPGTYLLTLYNNLLEDFSRKKFGYPRPPVWLQRLGEQWVSLWRRLCLEREPLGSLLILYQHIEQPIQDMVRAIKAKIPNCGQAQAVIGAGGGYSQEDDTLDTSQLTTSQAWNEETPVSQESIDHQLTVDDMSDLLEILSQALSLQADESSIQSIAEQTHPQAQALAQNFALEPSQLLLLRLVYQQNHKLSTAARLLKMPDHQARRQLKRAEKQIKEILEASGIHFSSFILSDS